MGRKTGARNKKNPPVVEKGESICPKCKSTERTPYVAPIERAIRGSRDGTPHTHIIWRRTSCADCGQFRFDKSYENRPQQTPKKQYSKK